MIKALIVDDEPYSCEALASLLEKYCPQVKVLDICYSAQAALKAISAYHPQIVFLDIELPQMNGFELLEQLPAVDFKLIFTTSYDQYAIKAIRWSALDYLLKPIDKEELQKAIQKAIQPASNPLPQQIEMLLHKLNQPLSPVNKVAIPTLEGLHMVLVHSIIYCESESNYTKFVLKDGKKITASRSLKEVEEMLEEYSFARVHHSFLVNLNEVEKYIKGDGGYLLMSNGSTVDVSRSRKEIVLKRLQPYKQ